MQAKTLLSVVGCSALAACLCLIPHGLKADQPGNPSPVQVEGVANAGKGGESMQGELRRDLEAIFKVQIEALELQKRQLAEDEAEQDRQINEQESEAIAQLKAEFERQAKQINRQAAAQKEQLRRVVKRQAAQLDLQAAMLKAQLGLQTTVMTIQASAAEARINAARRPSSPGQN